MRHSSENICRPSTTTTNTALVSSNSCTALSHHTAADNRQSSFNRESSLSEASTAENGGGGGSKDECSTELDEGLRLPVAMIDDEDHENQQLNVRLQNRRNNPFHNDALMEDLDDIIESPTFKTESGDIWDQQSNDVATATTKTADSTNEKLSSAVNNTYSER